MARARRAAGGRAWARRSRLEPLKKLARTVGMHWDGILAFFPSRITSVAIESVNGLTVC